MDFWTLAAITVIIIMIVAMVLESFRKNKYMDAAFYGLRPASTGLIAAAGLSVTVANILPTTDVGMLFNWKGLILGIVIWMFTNLVKKTKKLHPIVFILASAVVGIVFSMG